MRCGLAFDQDRAWVDNEAGGFICGRCRERWRDLIELDANDLRNLAELATPRGRRGAALAARPRVAQAVEALIVHHLGRRPRAALQP